MELRHICSVLALAEELHFRRAAERVGLAQTALSAQIKALEDELGFALFFRTTRHVSLTQAGVVFVNEAKAVLARLDEAIEATRAAADEGLQRIRIGGIDAALIWFLPPVIQAFRKEFPNVWLPLTEVSASAEQAIEIVRHRVDVAFFRPPPPVDGIAWKLLYEEGVLVALPDYHRLCAERKLTAMQLRDEPFISYPRSARPFLHGMLATSFSRAGLRPRVVMEAIEKSTLLRLVAQGLGVGLVPQWVCLQPHEGVTFRPYASATAPLGFAIGWRKSDRSETIRRFVEIASSHAESLRPIFANLPKI